NAKQLEETLLSLSLVDDGLIRLDFFTLKLGVCKLKDRKVGHDDDIDEREGGLCDIR
ncbi:10562_t:CDS:1, partial [Cetraspora pellucida]